MFFLKDRKVIFIYFLTGYIAKPLMLQLIGKTTYSLCA
jgi:hypothetical protein